LSERCPARLSYSFEKSIKFIRESIDRDLLETPTCQSFFNNDEDWKYTSLKEYFYSNREEKINLKYSKINVNCFLDKKRDYHLCTEKGD